MIKKNNGTKGEETTIGETTPIKIGFVIILLGLLSSAIWWAATMNTKLDNIISAQSAASAAIVKLDSSTTSSISELKVKDIALDKAIADCKAMLDKDISDLKLKLALYAVDVKNIQDKIFPSTSSSPKQ